MDDKTKKKTCSWGLQHLLPKIISSEENEKSLHVLEMRPKNIYITDAGNLKWKQNVLKMLKKPNTAALRKTEFRTILIKVY